MVERFSDIEKAFVNKRPSLEERLKEYPELKAKIEAMRFGRFRHIPTSVLDDAQGEADHRGIAADGERGFTRLGSPPATKKGTGVQRQAGCKSQRKKKLYWYTRRGKIEIEEQIFTRGRQGPQIRPFCESAGVECRGYSEGLQRAMTDFGADEGVGERGGG